MLDPYTHEKVVHLLRAALAESLAQHRQRFPALEVEVATYDEHAHLIPALAEMLADESRAGTKGMTVEHPDPDGWWAERVALDMQNEEAVLLRQGDDVMGWATLSPPIPVGDAQLVEFGTATVDGPYRGTGLGKLLVDARELLAVESRVPLGEQPIAFCNPSSARIYNRAIWHELQWHEYKDIPPWALCSPQCAYDEASCTCTVLAMNVDALASLVDDD